MLQKSFGGGAQARPFTRVDGFLRCTEIRISPVAYFDEYDRIVVAHDQVNFAEAAAIIAL